MPGAILRHRAEGIKTIFFPGASSAGNPCSTIHIAMRDTCITLLRSRSPPPVEINGVTSEYSARPLARIETQPSPFFDANINAQLVVGRPTFRHCTQCLHQRRNIDVVYAAAFDVRDRTVLTALPQKILGQAGGLAGFRW